MTVEVSTQDGLPSHNSERLDVRFDGPARLRYTAAQ
jgi:hypothetical protein